MMTLLYMMEDAEGTLWRLALDESPGGEHPLVVLQCYKPSIVEEWVHVKHVTSEISDVGVSRTTQVVTEVDQKKCRSRLVDEMALHGAAPLPDDARSLPHAMNLGAKGARSRTTREIQAGSASVKEPTKPTAGINLLEYLDELERHPSSMSLTMSTLVQRLREAFYLAQDLTRAVRSARAELDHLITPANNTPAYASRIEMFDRWVKVLAERGVAFLTIQAPAQDPKGEPPPSVEQESVRLLKAMAVGQPDTIASARNRLISSLRLRGWIA